MYKKPFTIIKKKWEDFLRYYTWELKKYNLLSEMEENKEQIFITPFSQAKERWFEVIENQEKIISILIDKEIQLTKKELEESFLNTEIILDWELNENYTKEDYSKIVDDIIKKEIWNWEWSNFCIAQKIKWQIKDFEINKALTIFDRIVESEFWSYMQFIFFDWNEFFIWASPERNVSVEKNIVRMNPISWTFRKSKYTNYKDFKNDFIPFLNDQKEINELFMCVDEELKMMSKICSSGWMVVWPILKEMANLIHTEYLLSWQTNMKKLDVFRESIWACTVVWSPIESAFKIVKKYENFDRRYYAWSICHMKEDLLDSSIMIRTINIKNDWNIEMFVWASLVKDSVWENEYHETKEKSKWVLNALLWIKKEKRSFLEKYYLDDEVQELIQKRNQNLSKTWFFKQDLENIKKKDEKILIINNEDDFTNMIAHILKISWYNIELKRFSNINIEDVKQSDITLIGPWPWNPLDNNEKMNKNIEIIDYLYKNNKKFFWICLWHQLICRYLKIEVKRKNTPTQWEQIEIDLYWNKEKVAFYNTFAGFYKENLDWIEFSKKEDWEIYSLKWENFFSFQFHPESILTQNWLNILNENLNRIIW